MIDRSEAPARAADVAKPDRNLCPAKSAAIKPTATVYLITISATAVRRVSVALYTLSIAVDSGTRSARPTMWVTGITLAAELANFRILVTTLADSLRVVEHGLTIAREHTDWRSCQPSENPSVSYTLIVLFADRDLLRRCCHLRRHRFRTAN